VIAIRGREYPCWCGTVRLHIVLRLQAGLTNQGFAI